MEGFFFVQIETYFQTQLTQVEPEGAVMFFGAADEKYHYLSRNGTWTSQPARFDISIAEGVLVDSKWFLGGSCDIL